MPHTFLELLQSILRCPLEPQGFSPLFQFFLLPSFVVSPQVESGLSVFADKMVPMV